MLSPKPKSRLSNLNFYSPIFRVILHITQSKRHDKSCAHRIYKGELLTLNMDSRKTGIVNLEDLPETDWLYFNQKGIIKTVLDSIVQSHLYGTKNKCKALSKLTGFSYQFISKLYLPSRDRIKIAHLKFLLSFLLLKKRKKFLSIFEKSVVRIGYQKSILNPLLPFNFNSKMGFKFLADLFTDGSLNSNFQVTYANSNINFILDNLDNTHKLLTGQQLKLSHEEYNNLVRLNPYEQERYMKELIPKKTKVRIQFYTKEKVFKDKKTFVYQNYYPTFLGKILFYSLRIPKGRRVYTNPKLPEFLFKKKSLLGFFMGNIFSNEGHVSSHGCGITHSIDVTEYTKNLDTQNLKNFLFKKKVHCAPNLLWDYKKIFYLLGCKKPSNPYVADCYTTTKKEIHAKWQIYVGGQDIVTLLSKIDFDSSFRKKLQDYVNSVHIFKQSKEMRINQILNLGKKLQLNKGHFTVNDLCNKLNLEKSGIKKNIKRAREKGLISINSYEGNTYCYVVGT